MAYENKSWFKQAAFVVEYESTGPSEEYSQTLVLKFVPGKFWQKLGWKSESRVYVGGWNIQASWYEVYKDKPMVLCEEWKKKWLLSICKRCNANRRLIRKMERRKIRREEN